MRGGRPMGACRCGHEAGRRVIYDDSPCNRMLHPNLLCGSDNPDPLVEHIVKRD